MSDQAAILKNVLAEVLPRADFLPDQESEDLQRRAGVITQTDATRIEAGIDAANAQKKADAIKQISDILKQFIPIAGAFL